MTTMPRITKRKGGGVRSHRCRIPLLAAAHVSAIHTAVSTPTITAVRRDADSVAPERRHAVNVAHARVVARSKGITTNAAMTGSLSW